MTEWAAYYQILENDCKRYCPRKYPDCKNGDCRWYVALNALKTLDNLHWNQNTMLLREDEQ